MEIGLGIIGLGGVSRFYVDALASVPAFALAAVCDLNPDRLAPFRDREGIATYEDAAALLADPAVEAVVLDTPVATHVPLGRAALEAGRHVCCEKPLALTRADADALAALAADRDVTLMTAFHRRYNRNLPASGMIDRAGLASVEVRYLEQIDEHTDDLSWYATTAAEGGGCIVDNGPNAVDVVRHLFGDMTVESVDVERSEQGVDLRAEVRGHVAGGVAAAIHLDWAFPGECKELCLRWTDGRQMVADMLGGFSAFKSSLEHEYIAVLEDFAGRIASRAPDPDGPAATGWVEDVLAYADKPAGDLRDHQR